MELNENEKIKLGSPWQIQAGGVLLQFTEYCDTVDEVLDFVGRLLYGNVLFETSLVMITDLNTEKFSFPETKHQDLGRTWLLESKQGDQLQPARWLTHRHDVFGMLIAELRQGADHIAVCHRHFVFPEEGTLAPGP